MNWKRIKRHKSKSLTFQYQAVSLRQMPTAVLPSIRPPLTKRKEIDTTSCLLDYTTYVSVPYLSMVWYQNWPNLLCSHQGIESTKVWCDVCNDAKGYCILQSKRACTTNIMQFPSIFTHAICTKRCYYKLATCNL